MMARRPLDEIFGTQAPQRRPLSDIFGGAPAQDINKLAFQPSPVYSAKGEGPEPSFLRDVIGKTVMGELKRPQNAITSGYNLATETAKGLYGAATTPLIPGQVGESPSLYGLNLAGNIGRGVVDIARGAGQKLIPGRQEQEAAFESVYKPYTPSNIGRTLQEDPARVAMDVTGILYGGGALARGAGVATKTGALERAGAAGMQLGEEMATVPVKGLYSAAKTARGAAASPLRTAERAKDIIVPTTEANLDSVITDSINKAVRPSVSGRTNAAKRAKFDANAVDAVKSITQNKKNLSFVDADGNAVTGKLPSNLREFEDAVAQTKKSIFDEYDAMQKQAGLQGAQIDLMDAANALKVEASKPVTRLQPGGISKYADEAAARLEDVGKLSPQEAQEYIATVNSRLNAFYKNPTPDGASQAAIDALVANNVRRSLDDAITTASGPGYQELKRRYGALSDVEKDISRRARVDARKNAKGLIDFSDIYTAGEAVKAVASLSGSGGAKALSMAALKSAYKHLNNPNREIRRMFEKTDQALIRAERVGATQPINIGAEIDAMNSASSAPTAAPVATTQALPRRRGLPAPEQPSGSAIELPGPVSNPLEAEYDALLQRARTVQEGTPEAAALKSQLEDVRLKMMSQSESPSAAIGTDIPEQGMINGITREEAGRLAEVRPGALEQHVMEGIQKKGIDTIESSMINEINNRALVAELTGDTAKAENLYKSADEVRKIIARERARLGGQ